MLTRNSTSLSLSSRSARYHLGIVVALLSVIPLLAFWYLRSQSDASPAPITTSHVAVYVLMIVTGTGGYLLLRNYFHGIGRLRSDVVEAVSDEITRDLDIEDIADDVAAIKHCMELMKAELHSKVALVEREKERLEAKLYQARKMECLGTMAAGVAHDFNNILAAIAGNAGIAMKCLPDDSPARENVTHIEEATMRAVDLTNEIQAYAGHGRMLLSPVDISAAVRLALEDPTLEIPSHIKIDCHPADNLPKIPADKNMIQDLIRHLLCNAIEAISETPGTIMVSTGVMQCSEDLLKKNYVNEAFPVGECVYLEVRDTGCGIKPEIYDRVFDPFFTTKLRGHGLGLSMVMGIIRGHGGTVQIDSNPDQGTSFRILFPEKTTDA